MSGMAAGENTNDESEDDEVVNDDNWHRQQPAKVQRVCAQWTSATASINLLYSLAFNQSINIY